MQQVVCHLFSRRPVWSQKQCDYQQSMLARKLLHLLTQIWSPHQYSAGIVPCFVSTDHILPAFDKKNRHSLSGPVASDNKSQAHLCSECGTAFAKLSALKRHVRADHPEDESRQFTCEVCSEGFSDIRALKRHNRTHFDDRLLHCVVCDKKFMSSATLKRHLMIHSGERAYGCAVCDMRFITSTALKRHLLTHSDERPQVWPGLLCFVENRECCECCQCHIWNPEMADE